MGGGVNKPKFETKTKHHGDTYEVWRGWGDNIIFDMGDWEYCAVIPEPVVVEGLRAAGWKVEPPK